MRLHYYMQYFPGPDAAGTRQPFTLAKTFAARGHHVVVVSANANLDTGLPETEIDERVGRGRLRVLRLPTYAGGRGANLERLKAYVGFMGVAAVRGMALARPDVVVGSVQPLFTGLSALAVAKAKRVPFVLEVRDLWPDALVVKRAISSLEAQPLFAAAGLLYRAADRIVCITPGIRKELISKGIAADRIDCFPNGLDPCLFEGYETKRAPVREQYGWSDDFVAIYTGSFTTVTAMDVVVRAAARLAGNSRIRFELFGSGPTRSEIQALARLLGARNVTFHDPVPKVEVPGLLAASDVALMSLFDTPLAHIYLENKLIDYMGAGKPIIAAMRGEQVAIIEDHDAGWVVAPGDDAGMARLVERASAQSSLETKGKAFVYDRMLLPDILDRYARVVEAAACGQLASVPAWEPAP